MQIKREKIDVVVIGAGLTGLTVAYELAKTELSFLVIEKDDRYGGVIHTVNENGFMYETGPNTGIIGSPEIGVLLDELKDDLNVQIGDKAVKRRLILKNGKWEAMPSGLLSAIQTPLYSFKDKLRILGEPFRKRGNNPEETLDQLVLRRMGKSFLNYAIDPFILGVYAGDPSKLVTQYAFPKLFALEQNYGSFIGGTIKKRKEPKSEAQKLATRDVFSLRNGLQELVDVLANKAGKEHLLLGFQDLLVQKLSTGYSMSGIHDGAQIEMECQNVISTINASGMKSETFPFLPSSFFEIIRSVKYAPTVEVIIGFRQWTGTKLEAFGGLIPHIENRQLLGVLFLSAFLPNRAPDGGALLTCFMGGVRNPEWIHRTDEEIEETVAKEMIELMGLDEFKPDLFKIIRHPKAIPQYSFESERKLQEINHLEKNNKGFYLGGNALDGIGIADRVKQGVQLVERVKKTIQHG
jgi:oxygen-dependent protoporphyrinogen oxidase